MDRQKPSENWISAENTASYYGNNENGKNQYGSFTGNRFTDKITLLVLGAYKELQKCFRI